MLRHAAEFLQAQDERSSRAPVEGSWWSRIGEAIGMGATSFTHMPHALGSLCEGELLGIEERLLAEIAGHGRAVIVGCGAAQMLKGRPQVLSVLVHAPTAWRINRVRDIYRIADGQTAEQAVLDSDRNRARFVQQLSGTTWTDAATYDLTLDTSILGLEACLSLIVDVATRRQLAAQPTD